MERADGFGKGQAEYIRNEIATSNGSSTSEAEFGDILADSDVRRRGKEKIGRVELLDGEHSSFSRGVHKKSHETNFDLNVDRRGSVTLQDEDTFSNIIRTPVESLRLRPRAYQRDVISEQPVSSRRPTRGASGQGRFNHFLYHDQGPSNYDMYPYYEQDKRERDANHDLDGPPRFENMENSRAELQRKIDELKDQLSRFCDVMGPEGRNVTNHTMISSTLGDPYSRNHQEGLISSHGVNEEPLAPDDRCCSSLRDSYPCRGQIDEYLSYAATYQQEMFQRPLTHEPQSGFNHWPYHEHFHGYYGDENHDLFVLHPNEYFFHQLDCSCVHCCNKNRYLPPKVDSAGSYNQRSRNDFYNPNCHHHLYPVRHGLQGYTSGGHNLHTSYSTQSLTPNSTDLDSENDGVNHNRPRKVVVAHRNAKVCRPIAGGAPFVACCNCFELLKLPRKHIRLAKNQQKLKCGACSSVILFELRSKVSTVPVSETVDHVSTEIDDGFCDTVDAEVGYRHGGSDFVDSDASSNDYDDSQPKDSSADKKSNSGEPEKQLDRFSSASGLSEDEQITETLVSGKHGFPSARLHVTEVETLPSPRLSSEECPDCCSANVEARRFDKSRASEFDQNTPPQNSVEDSAVATETDMSLNEFPNSGVSQDSEDDNSKEHSIGNQGAESFFAGLIKKTFGDFTNSTQTVEDGRSQVFVNEHLIPDHLLKKAEKLAGPIQPGEYWYDAQAGFWGVMGHPCLGLIMPNIEEFNYPMPENCAAGNTRVFVNGRELHQRDLDLLARRGLPKTRERFYLVEMSGKVVDEHTGEELHSLGKLAPTVEKAKHGFGMKVPRFIARLQS